jgi:hypothetical protein
VIEVIDGLTPTTMLAWLPDSYAVGSHAVPKSNLGKRFSETLCGQKVELDGRRTRGRQIGELGGFCGRCCEVADKVVERPRND